MRLSILFVMVGLIASSLVLLAIPARGDPWAPQPVRSVSPHSASPGYNFSATITFTAPTTKTTIYLNEGGDSPRGDGATWYTPKDYTRFHLQQWSANPKPSTWNVNSSSSWIWAPGDYGPGQKISLTYQVKVSSSVVLGNYPVDGVVGRVVNNTSEEVAVGGDMSVNIVPVSLNVYVRTDKSLYFGGDFVNVTAVVTDPGSQPVRGATVSARLLPPGARVVLTEGFPGSYQGSYQLASGAPVGTWTVEVKANDSRGNVGNGSANFEVGFQIMALRASSDKTAYHAFETVMLSASLSAPDGSPVSRATVTAKLNRTGEVKTLDEKTAGVYTLSYPLASIRTMGDWKATITAKSGTATSQADVTWNVGPAVLVVTSSLAADSVRRLEVLRLTVTVSYPDGSKLAGATLRASPDDAAFPAQTGTSDSAGAFTFAWSLAANAPLGTHTVQVQASHPTGSGHSSLTFKVLPTTLVVATSAPSRVASGDKVAVSVSVRYLDGTAVTGATVKLSIAGTDFEGLPLTFNASSGRYEASITISKAGSLILVVSGSDAYGNTGSDSLPIVVEATVARSSGPDWGLVSVVVVVVGVAAIAAAVTVRRARRRD